jgi:hypothetical protein
MNQKDARQMAVLPVCPSLPFCCTARWLTVVLRGTPCAGFVCRTIGLSGVDLARILGSLSIGGEQK